MAVNLKTVRELIWKIAYLQFRYKIGDVEKKKQQLSEDYKILKSIIDTEYDSADAKVNARDVIKDVRYDQPINNYLVDLRLIDVEKNHLNKWKYLTSNFDASKLGLEEERVERRVRKLLADKEIQEIEKTLAEQARRIIQFRKDVFHIKWVTILLLSFMTMFIVVRREYRIDREDTEALEHWRSYNIAHSPTVCITRTGHKYHKCYHYEGRNRPVSMFEAINDLDLEPCMSCDPGYMTFPEAPKSRGATPVFFTIIASLIFLILIGVFYDKRKNLSDYLVL